MSFIWGIDISTLDTSLEPTEFLDQDEVDRCDGELRKLLPTGLANGLLPKRPVDEALGARWRPDYSLFFEKGLKLPHVTHRGDDPASWMRRTLGKQPGLTKSQTLCKVLELLERLLMAGSNPWNRRHDLDFATWEVVLAEAEYELRRQVPRRPDDDVHVKTKEERVHWMSMRLAGPSGDRLKRVPSRLQGIPIDEWRQQSVLGAYEYRVGHSALQNKVYPSNRHNRLTDVLCADLHYLKDDRATWWGKPGTRRRIRAMAQLINVFILLASGRLHGDRELAIQDWNDDIKWMELEWKLTIQSEG